MKNKKLLYILAPVVLLIWGGIFYKVFMYVNPPQEFNVMSSDVGFIEEDKVEKDTFEIVADYRDPFLDGLSYFNTGEAQNVYSGSEYVVRQDNPGIKNQREEKAIKSTIIKWPVIIYGGLIINSNSDKKVGLLKINKDEYLVKKNDQIKEVEILVLYADSLSVGYREEVKTIIKQAK